MTANPQHKDTLVESETICPDSSTSLTCERKSRELSVVLEVNQMKHGQCKPSAPWFSAVRVQFLICEVTDSALSRVTHMGVLVLGVVTNRRVVPEPT